MFAPAALIQPKGGGFISTEGNEKEMEGERWPEEV